MKRILSILSIIAMVLSIGTMIALPTMAEETGLVNLFDLDTASKGTLSSKTGALSSNNNYYSTDYIEVEPGDTLYFGINDVNLSYQLYIYSDTSATSFQQIKSAGCTVVETVPVSESTLTWGILSYTIPEGYTQVRVTCRVTFADQYLLTKNQPFTNEERVAYFTSPVTNLYVDKGTGIWQNDGTIRSSTAHHSSELIEVAAGDKIYFGPCNISQGFQLYHWEGTENFETSTIIRHGNANLAVADRFPGNQVIYCFTAPSAGRIGLCNAPAYNDFYCITKNEELTVEVYKEFLRSINRSASTLFTIPSITSNIFKAVETQGYYAKDGTVTSSTSHYSGELISVKAGDVIYFGPVNLDQGFHLYDWHGTEDFSSYVRLNKADVQKYVVDTFPNGQAILAYEVTQTGRIGLVNATAYNSFFVATKNVRMTTENYYAYGDLHSNTMGNYSVDTGRYNNVVVKESVLNGKSALFTGDSICAAAADDDFFNNYYYGNTTSTAEWGGWAGRVGMFYGLEYLSNYGVSGASLSTTRDRWYNAPASTSKQQGRIYWQVTKAADYYYDYVILHGGVNDAWDAAPVGTMSDSFELEDFDLSTYAGGLEATFYYATKYHPESAIGYIINFEAPLHTSGNISTMGNYFEEGKKICEKWGIPYLDLFTTLNAETFDTNIYTKDLIHPNAAGYNIIGEHVAQWMETLQPYNTPADTEHDKTVIACVGDSLTKGEQSGDLVRNTYPAYLQEMLGDEYEVLNAGYGGAAVQTDASNTYKKTVQYKQSLEADPDQVIIMLGANDAKEANWDTADHAGSCAKFIADLKALVEQYQGLPSNPTVYLATPPYSSGATRLAIYNEGGMLAAIKALAAEMEIQVIDTYVPTEANADLLAGDGTHYTAAGYELIAGEIYKAITDSEAAPDVLSITEKDTAVEETDETKPLIRNWKAYYETATAFRIETVEDVEIFGDLIAAGYNFAGKTVYLENDLDFAGMDFKPLGAISGETVTGGNAEHHALAFAGIFDGQNHVFSNVNIEIYHIGIGLFPVLNGATIQNFGLDGGLIAGHDVVGGITAYGDEGTKMYNVWSSADVYASIRSSASGVGGIASNMRQSGCELKNVACYGTVSGVEYVSGIVAYTQNGVLTTENLVFGGTIDLRSKHKGVTPFVRYRTADQEEAVSGYYTTTTAEQRTVYVDETPILFDEEAFTSGEFAAYMNEKTETPVWTMKYGYAVPFGDESNAAPVVITKDSVAHYTDYAGQPIGFSLADGTYWYLNGVLTAAADMPESFTEEATVGVAISAAGADFDNDGAITTADAIMLLRYLDHKDSTMTEVQADVNADGKVKVFDVVRLLQVICDLPA